MSDGFTTDELIARGKAALEAGADGVALQLLEEASLREPGYADVHNLYGQCLLRLDRPNDAIAAFDRAIGLNALYADAHINRATALRQQGKYVEAERSLPRHLDVPESDGETRYPPVVSARLANVHCDLGDLYASHGFLREAAEQYRRACEIRPRFIDIRNKLARVLIDLGILDAAIRELGEALTVNPDYANARLNLGHALYRKGEIAEARLEWDRCIALRPETDVICEALASPRESVDAHIAFTAAHAGATSDAA